jgi:hypothetical protein
VRHDALGGGARRWTVGPLRVAAVAALLVVALAMATGTRAQTAAGPPATPGTIQGHLGPGGQVANYPIYYPGDKSVYTINLQIYPDDPVLLQNAGFKVFGPQAGKVYVTGGAQHGLQPNVSGNLISVDPGTYTIQVYDYDAHLPIDYTLSLLGNVPEAQQTPGMTATQIPLGPPAPGTPAPGAPLNPPPPANDYPQVPTLTGGPPPAVDCASPAQAGRLVVRTDGPVNLYVCTGAGGWVGK